MNRERGGRGVEWGERSVEWGERSVEGAEGSRERGVWRGQRRGEGGRAEEG